MTRHIIPKDVKTAIRDGYAWPGGYPLYIIMNDGAAIHPDCAREEYRQIAHDTVKGWKSTGWNAAGADINYEDAHLYCDHCNQRIESAYAEDEANKELNA